MNDQPKLRVQAIDIVRGIIMIIMALDHIRDFFHIHAIDQLPTNLATTTPLIFFTRWITHFCSPVFLFLSGISAYLAGRRKTKKELSYFLIKRGVWLIVADATIMTFALTFNPYFNIIFLIVLWAIGISMIILGLLVRTSPMVVIITGAAIVLGHNLFDYVSFVQNDFAGHPGGFLVNLFITMRSTAISLGGGRVILMGYAAIPCCGLMLLGYGAGQLYNAQLFTAKQRRKILLSTGVAAIVSFIVLRLINHYGDPSPALPQKDWVFTLLSFLNVTKYPQSLDFMCMTIGPALILLALIDNLQNRFTAFVSVYGRVPFFYFVVHFYLIHILLVIAFFASGYGAKDIVDPNVPFYFRPLHFGYDIWVVYAIWLFVVLALYKPCKWFNQYRSTHNKWWLKYI